MTSKKPIKPPKPSPSTLEGIFVSETHRQIHLEISLLKKRIHLVEGERKANYEANEETLKKNEERFKGLKGLNASLREGRKKMLETKDSLFKEISGRLGDKKAYEFRDKGVEDILDGLECKVGTLRNKENYIKWEKQRQGVLMEKVRGEEEKVKGMIEQGKVRGDGEVAPAVQKRLSLIKSTETSRAAMLMKISEADNIRTRYKNMITLLKSENFSMSLKISETLKQLDSQKSEIQGIHKVLKDSIKARKAARSKLLKVEEATLKDYQEREDGLHEARVKLQTLRDLMEGIASKLYLPKYQLMHRDSSVTEGLSYPNYLALMEGPTGGGDSSPGVSQVYQRLATLSGETNPRAIVLKFIGQRVQAQAIFEEEKTIKSNVRKGKLRKRFLLDKLASLQYSGGLKREKLEKRLETIDKEIEDLRVLKESKEQWLVKHGEAMEQMSGRMGEVFEKNGISDYDGPLRDGESEVPAENVVNLLKFFLKYLEKRFALVDGIIIPNTTPSPTPTPTSPRVPLPSMMILNDNKRGGETLFPFPGPSSEIINEGPGIYGALGTPTSPGLALSLGALTPSILLTTTQEQEDHRVERRRVSRVPSSGTLKVYGAKKDSSEDEDEPPVSRNLIKRQSQIMCEAGSRGKGRFGGSGGVGAAGGFPASPIRRKY